MISQIILNDNHESNLKIKPIETPLGIAINIYPAKIPINTLVDNNPNLTYIDLGDCNDKLKARYNLSSETELFILGIDSPNLSGNSAINVYNYEIYLKNGTQLEDLSVCDDSQITTSTKINDLDIINFEKAKQFSNNGYDIYDKKNKFYVDACSPANIDGNDITLEDRATYLYPNISICNPGCEYNSVNFDSQRFVCNCHINTSSSNINNNINEEKEKEDETYLEYFLSLINYKIIKCYSLFTIFENYYYNGGLYIGLIILVTSIILIFVFSYVSYNTIKIEFFKNIPTKAKLKEEYKKDDKNKIMHNLSVNSNDDIMNNSNPPRKSQKLENDNIINYVYNDNKRDNKNKITDMKSSDNNNNEHSEEKKHKHKHKHKHKKHDKTKSKDKIKSKTTIYINNNNYEKPSKNPKHKTKQNEETHINGKFDSNKPIDMIEKKTSKSTKNNGKGDIILFKKKNKDDKDGLIIDFTFSHLININEENIEKDKLNEIPYGQALRIDNRNFFQILLSVFVYKIGLLNLFCYRNPYTYFSLSSTVYLFEVLLDITMNCFLYSDDVVSEKYHNNGSLSMVTSFTLSIISNIISSIIASIVSHLTDFSELFDAIVVSVKYKKRYLENMIKFLRNIKIMLTIFYILEILLILLMTYYLFIFSTVYHYSQVSIVINYIIGATTSLAISVGLTLIISILRIASIKYHSNRMFNISRYIYDKF